MPFGEHRFHIPVMGTGFTLDSALRVAKLGLTTVVSLAEDRVIDRVRRHYAAKYGFDAEPISPRDGDARAKRITAWLDLLDAVVQRQMAEVRALPLEPGNDKWRHLSLLPRDSESGRGFQEFQRMAQGPERDALEARLTAAMRPGSVDVNIMTKIDGQPQLKEGDLRGPDYSAARAALRGFARSTLRGRLVLSAGVNPGLFGAMEQYPCFYRDEHGVVAKPVTLKVSDLRSALIQGKYLAKKGIEVAEFRIESGLNCGGHVFPTDGELMGPILDQFRAQRETFPGIFEPLIEAFYAKSGRALHPSARNRRIEVTAQGGVGNFAEMRRLLEYYTCDAVGWGSPFLLVPEVVLLDEGTRQKLAKAKERDLYVSDASPLGVQFNNLRGSSSEQWMTSRWAEGKPGSPCPARLLATNTEYGEEPLCTASSEYQKQKLKDLGHAAPPSPCAQGATETLLHARQCLCDHLGNGVLIALGVSKVELPVAVCPGPNLAYFDRTYALEEMVDHIYGRGPSLVPEDRPHFLAKELGLYLDQWEAQRKNTEPKARKASEVVRERLLAGVAGYRKLASRPPFPGENLASLLAAVEDAERRLGAAPAAQPQPEERRPQAVALA
jgi:hypothetical protein